MKKGRDKDKKLTAKERGLLWGEDGPYSQVRLCEEMRILDTTVRRVFLVVEAEINPFTFEYIQQHRDQFADDQPVLQLLAHADNRGMFGYVVSAGEVELKRADAREFARKQAEMTVQTIKRMHAFIIDEFDLSQNTAPLSTEDDLHSDVPLVWNEHTGKAEPAVEIVLHGPTPDDPLSNAYKSTTLFFIVLAFTKHFDFSKVTVKLFAQTLTASALRCHAVVEDVESFQSYMYICVRLPSDRPVDHFLRAMVDESIDTKKHPLFEKEYLVASGTPPTQAHIMSFLASLET